MLKPTYQDIDPIETEEWVDSLDEVIQRSGPERAAHLLEALNVKAAKAGVDTPGGLVTPYINTIPVDRQPEFPGDIAMERRIKSIIRWNAMVMVMRAKNDVGGHISTYASAATLLEVGFNHFFRGPDHPEGADFVYFQGHASPGVYSRSFLEGRFDETKLKNFRHEMAPGGGLSSYPHPWLMPDYWQFPTVSMGLGPITALYHARFLRYLEYRGLKDTSNSRVWCYIGDGELDEPETLGPIHLASRDNLDNLIYVVNCNLQRLDGPVRGNGKVIQEMESFFKGAGWNVVKCIWGSDWDPLLAADKDGLLVRRMGEILDGDYQKYVVEDSEYFLDHFSGPYPQLRELLGSVPADRLHRLKRGGHDPRKVYAAYKSAVDHVGAPTVVLAKTVKGYGLGEGGEGFNTAHQIKKITDDKRGRVLRGFRDRFEIPLTDDQLDDLPFYHPGENSPEAKYIRERRRELGGFVPSRKVTKTSVEAPKLEEFNKLLEGAPKDLSTTQSFVGVLSTLLRNKAIGKQVVPIVPDEARTFGMEGLMSTYGIWSPHGQLYSPVDAETMAPYREAKNGQAFEEGINEAGAMSTFVAAASSYANHGVPLVPFYIYYSMFGFQRVGDLMWLAGDQRCRGFLLGATAGRTTLNGEGLQHQDGHGHLAAAGIPNYVAYDPAFGFELAVIIQDGIRRMYLNNEDVLYYITLYNEKHVQPPMPKDSVEGIVKGMYKFRSMDAASPKSKKRVRLLGSGPILAQCVLSAQQMLAEKFGVSSDVYSVTSYTELRREALAADRWNMLHPTQPAKTSYVQKTLTAGDGPVIAASDNVRLVAEQIAPWVNALFTVLGTDGFGRSESRQTLRRHFEIDANFVAFAALSTLARQGDYPEAELPKALAALEIDPEKLNPMTA
jgi:pyruvate dehydrogenase E1 component